jgi:hypothetical protein
MSNNRQKNTYQNRISNYVTNHKVSLGLFLASYGVFYLTSVLLSFWTIFDWGKDITDYPPSTVNTVLPRSFIDPIFFVTSFPALIVGAVMLCNYCLRGITSEAPDDKQYVAILLTAFGFTYQVIGAWPLGKFVDFPWQWQKQIILNGSIFAWILYLLSLAVLFVGVVSLYKQSLIYHKKHIGEDEQDAESIAL